MGFEPIRTDRLLIRPVIADDTDALVARRSSPVVARFQDWPVPYPHQRADAVIRELEAMDGPTDDEWYMLSVVRRDDSTVVGDVAVFMRDRMQSAEIGYTLAAEHWHNGYATEATAALVAWLFDRPVTRVYATVHPENLPSVRVLERAGFVFEASHRAAYWVGDDPGDEWVFSLLREDHDAWRDRLTGEPAEVRLAAIDGSNYDSVMQLRTHKTQEAFVAPVWRSYARALFPPERDGRPVVPWLRAIEADGQPVGFAMLTLATEHHPEPSLWRFLVDRLHQGRGVGRRALDEIVRAVAEMGSDTLVTSWLPGPGSPGPFYLDYGFEPTGRRKGEEIEARLRVA